MHLFLDVYIVVMCASQRQDLELQVGRICAMPSMLIVVYAWFVGFETLDQKQNIFKEATIYFIKIIVVL